jgi:hypothetical protein
LIIWEIANLIRPNDPQFGGLSDANDRKTAAHREQDKSYAAHDRDFTVEAASPQPM